MDYAGNVEPHTYYEVLVYFFASFPTPDTSPLLLYLVNIVIQSQIKGCLDNVPKESHLIKFIYTQ